MTQTLIRRLFIKLNLFPNHVNDLIANRAHLFSSNQCHFLENRLRESNAIGCYFFFFFHELNYRGRADLNQA